MDLFRYLKTLAKFEPYCSSLEAGPVISRGNGDDIVFIGYQNKEDALRALEEVGMDEDFPEVQVAPDSRI